MTEERGRVIFLYKVVPGGADRSYGVNVARMAGLPRPILTRAAKLLARLEKESGAATDQLSFLDWFLAEQEVATVGPFSGAEEAVLDELRSLRIEHLTPLEALSLLDAWQKRLVR